MKSPVPDNFKRFSEAYPSYATELQRLKKIIDRIGDVELRDRVRARINVELGIVFLKNQEVASTLQFIFEREL